MAAPACQPRCLASPVSTPFPSRNELRTVLTAGLGNAFATFSGLAFTYYVPLTVLAVGTGTYGTSLALSRQRLLGSVLGAVLLVVGNRGLAGVPMPLGLAITLAALRLFGGLLRLQVGYKVGGLIVVMGWVVHDTDLSSWLPMRLVWTAFGIVLSLLSLRLFWPSRGVDLAVQQCHDLFGDLEQSLERLAMAVDPATAETTLPAPAPGPPLQLEAGETSRPRPAGPLTQADCQRLRARVLSLRQLLPAVQGELGTNPERHPAYQLLQTFENAASRLTLVVRGLRHHASAGGGSVQLAALHQAEAVLLRDLAGRLRLWCQRLTRGRQALPLPPRPPLQPPALWLHLAAELDDPRANVASLERLERIATRLQLCRQAQQAIVEAETSWDRLHRHA